VIDAFHKLYEVVSRITHHSSSVLVEKIEGGENGDKIADKLSGTASRPCVELWTFPANIIDFPRREIFSELDEEDEKRESNLWKG